MKAVYCSTCGTKSLVIRRAVPSHNVIVDLVAPHICTETPVDFDFRPIPPQVVEIDGEFVQKLNKLERGTNQIDSISLRDRRSVEHVKSDVSSMAPTGILDQMKNLIGSESSNSTEKDPGEE